MPRLDADEVKKRTDKTDRREYIHEQIAACKKGEAIQISDLIVNAGKWGGAALICLSQDAKSKRDDDEQQMRWNIKVKRDEWGNELGPGDVVLRKTQKILKDRSGHLISPMEMSRALQDGSYDKRFVKVKEFKIDNYGCIECNFEDAVHFLNIWGLHCETGRALTTKKETSKEPVNAPNGQKLHCHYWRYQEMTEDQYAKLPELKKRVPPLRGLDDIEDIEKWNAEASIRKDIAAEQRKQKIQDEAKKLQGANNK
ncbi:hypothetical protein KAR91_53330 [Candidatus Pacearchaeota archaeon]|nr:hypothetical protein [Candidatus Pacearchaeota archaeon]